MMRFTFTRMETPAATAENINPEPVRVVTEWLVDPLDVVAVGGDHLGVVLLLTGNHAMRVDGTWAIVAEKIRMAKRIARGEVPANENPAPPPPSRERPLPDEDEGRDDVEMLAMHDGPAEVYEE